MTQLGSLQWFDFRDEDKSLRRKDDVDQNTKKMECRIDNSRRRTEERLEVGGDRILVVAPSMYVCNLPSGLDTYCL